ncbi:MAG: c-type cytochrome [Chloroflexi bacterium]|nr:c-type cytochrome [Chloroflexota bacterium]
MERRFNLLFVALISILLGLSACGGTATQNSLFGEDDPVKKTGEPEEYADLANPYTGDPDAIAEGEILYQANCSSCHGYTGEGDGPASARLDPKPKNLAQNQPNLSDSYLFWRISEGGLMEPFNSIMPGWKGLLRDERIWQVITFLRTMIVQ